MRHWTWLRANGTRQFYFKYCSTFDSTDTGNIGPVADALCDALGADFTVFNPAFPTNKRTVYKGYLFVGDELLSESGMRHHPLTPMTDPSLVRVLQRQTRHKVGLVQYATVVKGAQAVREAFDALGATGSATRSSIRSPTSTCITLGEACADLKLVTGGSGMAMGLPANFVRQGLLESGQHQPLPKVTGPTAVLAGSCSVATQGQVAHMKSDHEAFELDPIAIGAGKDVAAAGARVGGAAAGREADSDLLDRRARAGQGRPGPARPRACGQHDRGDLGQDRAGAGREGRAPAGGRRRRDLRRGGRRARRGGPVHRTRDRSGRAVDLQHRRADAGAGA